MSARRPVSVAAALCALACAFVGSVTPAGAATQFGGYGEGAGQLREPWGLAVDQASGNVYVADIKNIRIDEFEASGSFVRAWGWGVLNGAEELQTCTTTCGSGSEGPGPGRLMDAETGVAVDNDPLSSSYQDIYVWDPSHQRKVQKFDSTGNFLMEFEVKESSEYGPVIAVGPNGRVYVGAKGSIQVFEPSGVLSESISLAGLSTTSEVTALAVDGSGDVFVKDSGLPGVHEFEANGMEKAVLDVGSETVKALTVDGFGDLFVGEVQTLPETNAGSFRAIEYLPSGEEHAIFGNESELAFTQGIAFSSALGAGAGTLYVTKEPAELIENGANTVGANVTIIPVPVSGPPTIEAGSVSAEGEQRGHAVVKATLDAEGNPTTYRVEYVSEAGFQASGYAGASSTPEVSLGSKFAQAPVSVELSGLEPGGVYHCRIVVSSSKGSVTSPDLTVQAVPPALVRGPWVSGVASTSATFAAEVDPLGVSTDYRIEYGTTTAYGRVLSGSVGEGETYVSVAFHRQDLLAGTVYHYRVVVHNEVGVYAGPDLTFMTQAPGGQALSLPDGRAWELVSPPDKNGALIGPLNQQLNEDAILQSAADGSGITYPASEPVGGDAVGHVILAQILSKRGAAGWSSQDVSPRDALPPEGRSADGLGFIEYWHVFSSDLSVGLLEPSLASLPPESPEATERTLYLRNSTDGSFSPLETQTDVQSGVKFGDSKMQFYAGTPDLSHVIFGTSVALTPEAVAPPPSEEGAQNLYEWSAGRLQLVNVMPATPSAPNGTSETGARLGSYVGYNMVTRAISNDGRWVVWSYEPPRAQLYVRDMVTKQTFQVGGKNARFETMSTEGSKVFFVEMEERRAAGADNGGRPGDLYVFDTATGTETDLTAGHGVAEPSAKVQDAVLGASEDGSYVYFVATGVLAEGAVSGADNVYVLHEAGGQWTTTYIATLSPDDSKSWRGNLFDPQANEFAGEVRLPLVSSRVSPSGRYLAFMSDRSLTGYDNLDALSGQPDEEVYLYDAQSNRLVCASCDPTGARPNGVFDNRASTDPLFVDMITAWSHNEGNGDHWLAGSIPGWEGVHTLPSYQPRYLLDDGRLFFDSPGALVPQDTNGLEDVYEYEPAGAGSCTSVNSTFSVRSGGCVSLISSGQSAGESLFVDASESGDDVFFDTNSRLSGEDRDSSYDIYDAHVCSVGAPCRSEAVSPPPCTSGDSCKAAPSPQPAIFGPAPSATFAGIGNVIEEAKASVKKGKAKTKTKRKAGSKKHAKHKKRKAGKARKARSSRKGR